MENTDTRVWTKEEIREGLQNDDMWVFRGVIAIYNFQTASEQENEDTIEHNGVGYNAVDGHIMASFAKQIKKWQGDGTRRFPTPLSRRQTIIARKKILKYSGQLAKIANEDM